MNGGKPTRFIKGTVGLLLTGTFCW